jgi:hypothetical protein
MNELPDKMPPRLHPINDSDDDPTEPTQLTQPSKAIMTRVPHVFSPVGTIVYIGCSVTCLAFMIGYGFGLQVPWYIILPCIFYTAVSSGIIAMGRIESNRDARAFMVRIEQRSELNEQYRRKMN